MESLFHHVEALRRDPTSESAAAQVRKRARAEGDLRTYVAVFMERGSMLADQRLSESAAVAYLEAAMVAEELLDWPLAADLFRHAYLADPRKRDALVLLGKALTQAGSPRELVPTLREMLRGTSDPAAKAELHLQLADFVATELQDRTAAMDEIRAALAADPACAPRAKEILGSHGLSESFGSIRDEAEHRPSQPAGRPSQSPRQAVMPKPPTSGTLSPQAANFRASISGASSPPPASKPSAPAPPPEPSADQVATLAQVNTLVRALEAAPNDVKLVDQLMQLGQVLEDAMPVIKAYEDAARANSDPTLRTYIRTRLGTLYTRMTDLPEAAVLVYSAILDDEPRHPEARRMVVARDGADAEAMTPEQEKLLIASLEKEATSSGTSSGTNERIMPNPNAPTTADVAHEPLPSAPTRPSMVSMPYARPSMPIVQEGRRLSIVQILLTLALVVMAAGAAFVTFTDRFWPEYKIVSRPVGASIYVDGKVQPEKTPAVLHLKPYKKHSIELRYPGAVSKVVTDKLLLGYMVSSSSVTTLSPKVRVARVAPVAARVELNGLHVGTSTALLIRNFRLDEPATLTFAAEGYETAQREFRVGNDIPDSLKVQLVPAKRR